MKVKLLNDGGFGFLYGLPMPIEIQAQNHSRLKNAVHIKSDDLFAAGAGENCKILPRWTFADDEFEVLDE